MSDYSGSDFRSEYDKCAMGDVVGEGSDFLSREDIVELNEDIEEYIILYRRRFHDSSKLLEAFRNDFQGRTIDWFKLITPSTLRELERVLADKGIDIPLSDDHFVPIRLYLLLNGVNSSEALNSLTLLPVKNGVDHHVVRQTPPCAISSPSASRPKFDRESFLAEARNENFTMLSERESIQLQHLASSYREEDKFGGDNDNFLAKWRIFTRHCDEMQLERSLRPTAFHHMLRGDAREYEAMHPVLRKMSLPERAAAVAAHFQ